MNKLGDLLTQAQGLANVNLGLLNIHVSYFTSKVRAKYYTSRFMFFCAPIHQISDSTVSMRVDDYSVIWHLKAK